ncbi:MAG: flagellar export chaperone FliS [bacterium]|jgi:flagellar protein FliS
MNPYSGYQNAYKRAAVNTLDQNKLIVMLYDGAIKNIQFALESMQRNEIERTHNALVKAKNIVAELMSSLNLEKGGEIAKNLQSLYNFMFNQLIEANIHKNPKPAKVALDLLRELREAWVYIGTPQKTAAPGQQPVRPAPGASDNKRVNLRG